MKSYADIKGEIMNFLEAVQSLKDGRCEGITRESWSGTTLVAMGHEIRQANGNETENIKSVFNLLATDYILVNPTPQTGTVVVKRWVVMDSTGCQGTYLSEAKAIENAPNSAVIELTGKYERNIKPKVTRREEIPSTCVSITKTDLPTNGDYKFYAEWLTD